MSGPMATVTVSSSVCASFSPLSVTATRVVPFRRSGNGAAERGDQRFEVLLLAAACLEGDLADAGELEHEASEAVTERGDRHDFEIRDAELVEHLAGVGRAA